MNTFIHYDINYYYQYRIQDVHFCRMGDRSHVHKNLFYIYSWVVGQFVKYQAIRPIYTRHQIYYKNIKKLFFDVHDSRLLRPVRVSKWDYSKPWHPHPQILVFVIVGLTKDHIHVDQYVRGRQESEQKPYTNVPFFDASGFLYCCGLILNSSTHTGQRKIFMNIREIA